MFIMLTSASPNKNVLVKIERIITAIRPHESLQTHLQMSLGNKATVLHVVETPVQIYTKIKEAQSSNKCNC